MLILFRKSIVCPVALYCPIQLKLHELHLWIQWKSIGSTQFCHWFASYYSFNAHCSTICANKINQTASRAEHPNTRIQTVIKFNEIQMKAELIFIRTNYISNTNGNKKNNDSDSTNNNNKKCIFIHSFAVLCIVNEVITLSFNNSWCHDP